MVKSPVYCDHERPRIPETASLPTSPVQRLTLNSEQCPPDDMLESGKERWKINHKYLPVLFLCPKSFNTHSLSYASCPAVEETES